MSGERKLTVRLPAELVEELEQEAHARMLGRNKLAELLLRRGLVQFRFTHEIVDQLVRDEQWFAEQEAKAQAMFRSVPEEET